MESLHTVIVPEGDPVARIDEHRADTKHAHTYIYTHLHDTTRHKQASKRRPPPTPQHAHTQNLHTHTHSRHTHPHTHHQMESLHTVIVPEGDPVARIDEHRALVQGVPCQYGMFSCHMLDITLPTLQHACGRTETLQPGALALP